jgi:hypothetical protein
LVHRLFIENAENAKRISAQRQNWLDADFVDVTSRQRKEMDNQFRGQDRQIRARWWEWNAGGRTTGILFDLIERESIRARKAMVALDDGDVDGAIAVRDESQPPIRVINDVLRLSGIPIRISPGEDGRVLASKAASPPFVVAQLSDGERNALLVAANVLTVPPGTLVLIDEPERHLHRSISSPLLGQLLKSRPDCAFVISTHDVMLPLDHQSARTVLLRSVTVNPDGTPTAWDADLAPELDEAVKRDILGARRRILFVEGSRSSLDEPLYSLLFPNVSVLPKATSREVETAVVGCRAVADLHWLRVVGLVDNDRRTAEDIDRLRARGIHALPVYSVESIYYRSEIQRRVAVRHAEATGGDDAATRVANAKAGALEAVGRHADRLATRVAEKSLREAVFGKLPTRETIEAGDPIEIRIDVAAAVNEERARFRAALAAGDLEQIIDAYPVRETEALSIIATRIGMRDRAQYESAVLKLLLDDPDALAVLRGLFGDLIAALG